jgi:hypothetical protein
MGMGGFLLWGGGGVEVKPRPSPNGSLYRNTEEVGTCLFDLRLLLWRFVSFHAFSYGAYLHSAPSPKALNFTTRLLL